MLGRMRRLGVIPKHSRIGGPFQYCSILFLTAEAPIQKTLCQQLATPAPVLLPNSLSWLHSQMNSVSFTFLRLYYLGYIRATIDSLKFVVNFLRISEPRRQNRFYATPHY